MKAPPFYTRVALTGVAMFLTIEVVIFVWTLLSEPRSQLWYSPIVASIVLAGGLIIWFWRPWGLVVGVLGGLFSVLFSVDSMGTNLSSPDSFLDFAYRPIIWSGGTILLLGGSLAGFVEHFGHRAGESGPRWVVWATGGLVAVVVAVSAVSAVLTFRGIDSVSAEEKAGATTVKISGWKFSTSVLTVTSNDDSKLVIENKDGIVHTFTVDGLGIDRRLGPFGEELITLNSPAPGRYEFLCRIPGHTSMRGTLIIE